MDKKSKVEQYVNDAELRKISTNTDFSVVMANDLVKGTSNLSLNELKLLRLVIMQITPEDIDLHPYIVEIKELQKIIGVDNKKLYHYAQKMCLHLLKEVVLIGDGNPKHKWEAFQWVSYCKYDAGKITIKLNDALKPYIVGLQRFYTKFKLEEIVRLNTTYAIRLLELLHMTFKTEFYGQHNEEVYIDLQTLRKATNTEQKYHKIDHFKKRVIESAINELNEKSEYHITYRDYKSGRAIVGFYFLVQQQWEYDMQQKAKQGAKQVTVADVLEEQQIIDADFIEVKKGDV